MIDIYGDFRFRLKKTGNRPEAVVSNEVTWQESQQVRPMIIPVVMYSSSGQGKTRNRVTGYSYADIENLAVNAYYAQGNWMRWSNAKQIDASDFHGHEFRAAYVLPWKIKVLARFYSVESNLDPQDGTRFRIDFNRKF